MTCLGQMRWHDEKKKQSLTNPLFQIRECSCDHSMHACNCVSKEQPHSRNLNLMAEAEVRSASVKQRHAKELSVLSAGFRTVFCRRAGRGAPWPSADRTACTGSRLHVTNVMLQRTQSSEN